MRNYLSHFNPKHLRIIRAIGREADRRQLAAYIVGGIVRDIILKRKNLDLDITVEGNVTGLAKAFAQKWKARLIMHKQFGTASLILPGGMRVDFAATRKEHYVHSGALPTVQRGNLQEDLFRRDFTINAMAIAINASRFGELIDLFGGLQDLTQKTVSVLHDQSFIDDPTRILRAVRFEQRFDFCMEHRTLALIKSAITKKAVRNVKPPRYFAEFKKILCELDPTKSLKRLHAIRGLQFLGIPTIRLQGVNRLHGHISKIRNKQLYKPYNDWWLIYFMELIAGASNTSVTNLLAKFHFTKNAKKSIQQGRKAEGIIKALSMSRMRASAIYQILKPLTHDVVLYLRVKTSRSPVERRIDRFLTNDRNVTLRINGSDLKKIGITSGQEMGRILDRILYSKIDRKVRTKQDELNVALHSLGKC